MIKRYNSINVAEFARKLVIQKIWTDFKGSSEYQRISQLNIYGIQNESNTKFKLVVNDTNFKDQRMYHGGKSIEFMKREIILEHLNALNININVSEMRRSEIGEIIKNHLQINDRMLTILDEYL